MKHYIIVKFKDGFDYKHRLNEIISVFNQTLEIDGVNKINIKKSNSDRENRYDLMIELDMEKQALDIYDSSLPHKMWKETFGEHIKEKTIFDCD